MLIDQCLPKLVDCLEAHHPCGGRKADLWKILGQVQTDLLAVAILSGAIRIIGRLSDGDRKATLRAAMDQIGTNFERECRSARLLKNNAEGYARIGWDVEQLHRAGSWGVARLMQAVPGMFEIVKDGDYNYLIPSAKAEDIADETLWACVRNNSDPCAGLRAT